MPVVGTAKPAANQGDDNQGQDIHDPPKEWPADPTPEKISPDLSISDMANHLDIMVDRDGIWDTIATIYGKEYNRNRSFIPHSGDVIKADGSLKVRYQWNVGYRTDQIAYVQSEKLSAITQTLPLLKASHSRLGDISKELSMADGINTELIPKDTITLVFESPPVDQDKKRELVFVTKGRYAINAATTFFAEEADTTEGVNSFKMCQNFPNPSNPGTTFEFALPHAEHVNISIYNILGQKVATIADEVFEAGRHKIQWDGGSSSGQELASGIYFAKLVAGHNSSTKKVVVVK